LSYFHFTLGPVQGFVSQARRTRDFWAGSFLLSWLSGVAMVATQKLGGKIEFPNPPNGYLDWIEGKGINVAPRQGSIPNRFKASVPADFDGSLVVNAVREAWNKLAEQVWNKDLQSISSAATRAVWERQNDSFWEISWVLSEDLDVSNLLDRRKNWRNYLPAPEPGVKCAIMEGWQELSGIEEMKKSGNDARRAFWQAVRSIRPAGDSDFVDGEMLCALALVKRRFARHFAKFSASIELGNHTLNIKGWELETGMPSVAYMAAVRWLEKVVLHTDQDKVAQLLEIGQLLAGRDEWDIRIKCLHHAVSGKQLDRMYRDQRRALIALDGNVFFEHSRANNKFFPDQGEVRKFQSALESLEVVDKAPTPFYAVLLMDGDSLGAQMSSSANQLKIARSLNTFTSLVPGVVHENNGFLIYAGGDDVLALLPLEDALPCALACRNVYTQAFAGTDISTTLSGAVLFAHVKTALGEVLRQAHCILDNEAKEGAGRDAIAVRVLKPGGDQLTWAQPWEVALDGGKLVLETLAEKFSQGSDSERKFSSKFFYRMRDRFAILEDGLESDQQTALLAADYISSGQAVGKVDMQQAREIIEPLLEQCRPVKRENGKSRDNWIISKQAKADAALLVRFLANKGVEVR